MILNKVYGYLTVEGGEKRNGRLFLCCKCCCGKIIFRRKDVLDKQMERGDASISCGCYKADNRTIYPTTFYTWRRMKLNCTSRSWRGFAFYGKLGIKYDPKWHLFSNFFADMGKQPENKILARYDRSKNFCKENCYWADKRQSFAPHCILVDKKLITIDKAIEEGITNKSYNTVRKIANSTTDLVQNIYLYHSYSEKQIAYFESRMK